MSKLRHTLRFLAVAVGAAVVSPPAAHAYWRGGVFVGVSPFPLFVGPRFYAPPPVYYAPPPVVYAPPPAYYAPPPVPYAPASAPRPLGRTCYAGPYVCPLRTPGPVGNQCSCPALGTPSYGTIR